MAKTRRTTQGARGAYSTERATARGDNFRKRARTRGIGGLNRNRARDSAPTSIGCARAYGIDIKKAPRGHHPRGALGVALSRLGPIVRRHLCSDLESVREGQRRKPFRD